MNNEIIWFKKIVNRNIFLTDIDDVNPVRVTPTPTAPTL